MQSESSIDYFSLDISKLPLFQNSGYLFFYKPDHPLAGKKNGMVALHRHIMSKHIHRWLTPNELVLFINGNHQDVRLDNLKLMTRADLMRDISNHPPRVELICSQCNNTFIESSSHAARRRYCSQECALEARRKFRITPEELEQLVWEMPTVQVAKLFDVSDKAIEKRCKKFGIKKPPPGYWAKLYAGQIDPTLEQNGESYK